MDLYITVFTPTFNRGYTIKNLYRSLLSQKYKNFEWLIIDNGTDNTEEIVKEYISEGLVSIKYYKDLKRIGINRAYNDAVPIAKGDVFFKVDDDDRLRENALSVVNEYCKGLDRKRYAGIAGLRVFPDGKTNGGEWKYDKDFIDVSNFDRDRFGLGGDKAEAYFTDVLRKYGPFPEIENEKYTDEALLYYRIANAGFVVRWINKKIYESEYLPDGVTSNWEKVIVKNPITYRRNMQEFCGLDKMPVRILAKRLTRYFYVFEKNGFNKDWIIEGFPNTMLIKILWLLRKVYLLTSRK